MWVPCSIRFRRYVVPVAMCAVCKQRASNMARHINPQAALRTPNPLPAPSEVMRASAQPVSAYDWRTEVQICALHSESTVCTASFCAGLARTSVLHCARNWMI